MTYSYDAAGRVATVNVDGYLLMSNIAWQPFGQAKSWTWGDGSGATRSYDTDGRMQTHTLAGVTRNITYDAAGLIRKIDDGSAATTSTLLTMPTKFTGTKSLAGS